MTRVVTVRDWLESPALKKMFTTYQGLPVQHAKNIRKRRNRSGVCTLIVLEKGEQKRFRVSLTHPVEVKEES